MTSLAASPAGAEGMVPLPSADRACRDHAIASLYRAAIGQLTWHQALHAAAGLFQADRLDLAVVNRAAQQRFLLTASSWDAADHCDTQVSRGRLAITALLRIPLDTHNEAYAALCAPGAQLRDPALSLELQGWAGHLQVALDLARRQASLCSPKGLIQTLIDALPNPTWILTSDRAILHANAAAVEARGDSAPFAEGPAGRLRLRNTRRERAFAALMEHLSNPASAPQASLDLRADWADASLLLHVRRQEPEHELASPRFVVSLFGRQAQGIPPTANVAEALGLTEAESRVATLLADGHSPEAIARVNGTNICTVRTQLAQVFRKLGVARQNDVVRLLCQNHSLWRLMAA